MHRHDNVIYMQNKVKSKGDQDRRFITKTDFGVQCGHKSMHPEERDMK